MTPREARAIATTFPGVDAKALLPIVDGAAEQAYAGLTVTRVVCGWRLVIDRTVGGAWLITAEALNRVGYTPGVTTPPDEVFVVASCIANDAGASSASFVDGAFFDVAVGQLRIAWHDADAQKLRGHIK